MTRIEPKHYDKIKKSMPLPCVDLLITHKDSLPLMLRNNEPGKAPWSASQTRTGTLSPRRTGPLSSAAEVQTLNKVQKGRDNGRKS